MAPIVSKHTIDAHATTSETSSTFFVLFVTPNFERVSDRSVGSPFAKPTTHTTMLDASNIVITIVVIVVPSII